MNGKASLVIFFVNPLYILVLVTLALLKYLALVTPRTKSAKRSTQSIVVISILIPKYPRIAERLMPQNIPTIAQVVLTSCIKFLLIFKVWILRLQSVYLQRLDYILIRL